MRNEGERRERVEEMECGKEKEGQLKERVEKKGRERLREKGAKTEVRDSDRCK